jgi:hypothetical protein
MIASAEMAECLCWVAENDVRGAVNAASSAPVSALDVIELAQSLLGGRARVERTDDESDPDFSALSVPHPFTVDTSRATRAGFAFQRVDAWLPAAVRAVGARLRASTAT